MKTRSMLVVAVVLLFASACPVNPASADKPHKSKGHGHGGHGHNHGQTFIGVSPGGVSFGYQNRNFGIQIGPYGGGFGGGCIHDCNRPVIIEQVVPVIAQPAFVDPAFVDPAFVQPAIAQPVYPAGLPQIDPRLSRPAMNPNRRVTIIPVNPDAVTFQREAERSFIEGRYENAAGLAKHALVEDPNNGYLHLFDSQAKLAIGDYPGATASLEKASGLLPQNELGYVVVRHRELYPTDHYDRHLKRLASQVDGNTDRGQRATLLGYHYAFLGYGDAAGRLLAQAVQLDPENTVARKLMTTLAEEIPAPQVR